MLTTLVSVLVHTYQWGTGMTEICGQCPSHSADTGGSDSYFWNPDKKQGRCMSCDLSTWEFKGVLYGKRRGKGFKIKSLVDGVPLADDPETPEGGNKDYDVFDDEVDFTPKAVTEVGNFRKMRGISEDTFREFNLSVLEKQPWRVQIDGKWESGVSDEVVATYPNGAIKKRRLDLPKAHPAHFWAKGELTTLFGMDKFPAGCSKKVTIVEGDHFDTPSAWQMLQSGRYLNPVVAIPSATPSGKLWEKCKGWLDSFDEIILSTDNDDPGRKVAETFFDLFPGKVYIMDHGSYKDANDFLMNGDTQAYKNAWWGAKKYSPAGFTASKEDWFAAIDVEDPYEYVPTPVKAFNEVARGLVKGGITVVKAPPGTGKSSYLRMLMHDLVVNKGQTVSCLMMEEQKSITARAMATYELKTNVKTKEDAETNGVTEDEVKQALYKVVSDEKFISFEVNPQDPVEDCLKQCKHAITIYNSDFIFIDHLQRLAYLSGTDTATSALTELGVKLTELAKRRNVGIICISHVNSDNRTKYASSIEEEAIVLIEMQRDKKSEDYEERNTTYLEVSKNRPYAVTGPAGMLTYDIETDMVTERLGPQEPKVTHTEDEF